MTDQYLWTEETDGGQTYSHVWMQVSRNVNFQMSCSQGGNRYNILKSNTYSTCNLSELKQDAGMQELLLLHCLKDCLFQYLKTYYSKLLYLHVFTRVPMRLITLKAKLLSHYLHRYL